MLSNDLQASWIEVRMTKSMTRWTLVTVLAAAAIALAAFAPQSRAAEQKAPHSVSAAHEQPAAGTVEHTGTAPEHEGVEIDERLVPLPPSKDTMVSAVWVLIIFVLM